jgi:predicted DNA-binding protein (MmcQ/YjbR family)
MSFIGPMKAKMKKTRKTVPPTRSKAEDPRLVRVTRICLTLPGARREVHASHARFFARNRTFAYFLSDHHGDGIVGVTCKVGRPDMKGYLDRDPTRFYVPDHLGPKGWIALCLDVKPVDWKEVETLVRGSYEQVTSKKMR